VLARWFFIRYWEGGPHLRIRLAGPLAQDEDEVIAVLSEGIANFRSSAPPTREEYYAGHFFDGHPIAADDLPWYPEGSVARIDYQPETLRYGGEHAMEANEQLFELSSRLALHVGNATVGSGNGGLSSAFVLMAAAIFACGEDLEGLGAYFEQYGAVWASMAGRTMPGSAAPQPSEGQMSLLCRLEREAAAGWEGNSAHAIWGAGVRQLAERLRTLHAEGRLAMPYAGRPTVGEDMCRNAVLGIVGSQIHMLNNRLGIPPAGEFLLARIVSGAVHALKQRVS
jgi:thiopeptide-type bacteriocin biosynthesis protein